MFLYPLSVLTDPGPHLPSYSESAGQGAHSHGVKWPVFEAPPHAEITNVYLHLHSTICPFNQAQTQLNLPNSSRVETQH
jgi:hypothetical protein